MSTLFRLLVMVGILAALLMPLVARADLATPDTIALRPVRVWQHMLKPNDMLIIARYDIHYGNLSAQPDYPITDTFTFTYTDSTGMITHRTAEPYPFVNLGYVKGIVAFYWAADDTDQPPWGDLGNISVTGTPLFVSPPGASYILTEFDWEVSTQPSGQREDLRQWLINSLIFLELDWNSWGIEQGRTENMATLVMTLGGAYQYASPSGEAYLGLSIPNITTMCPLLFTSQTTDIPHGEKTWTLAQQNIWEGIHEGDAIGNATEVVGRFMGVSRIWASTLLVLVFCIAIIITCSTAKFGNRLNNGLLLAYVIILIATPEGLFQTGLMALFAVVAVLYIADIFLSKRAA